MAPGAAGGYNDGMHDLHAAALDSVAALAPFGMPLCLTTLPEDERIRLWLLDEEASRRPLRTEQARAAADAPPFWSLCWPAGRCLAARFRSEPELVRGKHVVDLGCGSGVAAIAAALNGAAKVTAVDRDPVARRVTAENARASRVAFSIVGDLGELARPADLLVLADFFYDPANLPLIATFRAVCGDLLVAESRCAELERHGLPLVGTYAGDTLPAFGDPQFTTVRLHRSA